MENTSSRSRARMLADKLDPSAEAQLRHLIGGATRSQAIYVAAKLGIADQLTLGAKSAQALAEATHTNAAMLRRVLRFLVANGIFTEDADGFFTLNAASEYLQTTHPRSLRPSAIRSGEGLWNVSSHLLDAVQTGKTPHDLVHGTTFFDRMVDQGKAREFAGRMSSSTLGLGQAIAARDCFAGAQTVVDVGGGQGSLLASILKIHEHLRGVVCDVPAMLDCAQMIIAKAGLSARCTFAAGDFFQSITANADIYLLSWVLHDWDDDQARRILRACRAACKDSSILLIIEAILPERAQPQEIAAGLLADPFTLDLQMLLLTGGRERTQQEYRALLNAEGFDLGRTSGLLSLRDVSVLEALVRISSN